MTSTYLKLQACGREEECISTYKTLEDTHPVPRVRRQAANLRYIIEAPKLPVNPDERVQIPMLNEVERKKCALVRSALHPYISRSVCSPRDVAGLLANNVIT